MIYSLKMNNYYSKRQFNEQGGSSHKKFIDNFRHDNRMPVNYNQSNIGDITYDNSGCNVQLAPFDKLLMDFISEIEEPASSAENKLTFVMKTLEMVLKAAKIIYLRIQPFGSSVTRLALKDSDIDIFIHFKNPNLPVMKRIKKLLHYSKSFNNIILISTARVPIIKCEHIATGTKCDISGFSHSGCENTKLINRYFSLNANLRPVAIFLKYWLKTHNLHGLGKISTYALVWLLIFYLQYTGNKYLPSVKSVQDAAGKKNIVKFWDCNFSFDHLSLKPYISGTKYMLQGFFQFYSTFDFKNNIISPYLANVVPTCEFNDPSNLPNSFALYKELVMATKVKPLPTNHHVILQDPFEHNFNIMKQTSVATMEMFKRLCSIAQRILAEEDLAQIIVRLLKSDIEYIRSMENYNIQSTIKIKQKHFPDIFSDSGGVEKLFEAFCYVLEKIYLFQTTICDENGRLKEMNIEKTKEELKAPSESKNFKSIVIDIQSVENTDSKDKFMSDIEIMPKKFSKKIINCSTFLNVLTGRSKCKIKRKSYDCPFDIDFEERKSQICAEMVEDEISVKIEFIPDMIDGVKLNVDAPSYFINFLKQNCVPMVRNALQKLEHKNSAIKNHDNEEENKTTS